MRVGGVEGETTERRIVFGVQGVDGLCVVRRHVQDRVFELPDPAKRIEAWLYESDCEPRMLKAWRNPFRKPLSEVLAGMPTENWEDEP